MASFDDTFVAELRALRPTPSPDFTAKLDERAAAGFPRRPDDGGGKSWWTRLRAWLAGLTPRRALVPGGAFALVAVAIVTAVVALSNSGSETNEVLMHGAASSATAQGESGDSLNGTIRGTTGFKSDKKAGPLVEAAPAGDAEAGAEEAGGTGRSYSQAAKPLPSVSQVGEEAGAADEASEAAPPVQSNRSKAAPFSPRNRDIERSASIVLGTTPDKLAEASARVYGAVHQANGIVLHSTTRGSRHGGEASFDLLIPSGKLNDTLATFSGIAEVRSRHDATTDITAPTVSASEELQDSNARIESLIAQLGEAESESEREAVEGELRGERDHHAQLRASLERLEDRASMSRVSLRIVSGHGAGVVPSGDSGSWDLGDALHDAGHILVIAGGVAIIGLAILGPIALILLAAWLLNRFRVRRLRERALG